VVGVLGEFRRRLLGYKRMSLELAGKRVADCQIASTGEFRV
jgi:hypothetical protein